MPRHLSDGALAELLIMRCGLSFAEVVAFLSAREDVCRFAEESSDLEIRRDTVPTSGGTLRIGECFVEEVA